MATRKRNLKPKGRGGGGANISRKQAMRAAARRRQLVARCRADPCAFIEFVFDKPDGTPARCGEMHREWHDLADEHDRLLIVAPRGHWKTGQMVVGRTLWELGNNPDHLIKIICQSDAKAVKRLSEIREHIRSNKRLHMIFPHLQTRRDLELDWNKHMVTIERSRRSPDPSIEALGITSSASGDRATRIIADDVVDRRNAITLPRVRASIKEAWDDWVNLLLPGGRIIYVATLWHQSDLTHQLIASPSWAVAWYEITSELGSFSELPDGTKRTSGTPLWGHDVDCPVHGGRHILRGIEERRAGGDGRSKVAAVCSCGPWSLAALKRRRDELGERKFARGFSNRPLGDDEARVNPEWIQYWESPPADDLVRIAAFDLATSSGARSDWTACVVLAIDPSDGRIYVEDARHYKYSFPEKARLMKEVFATYRPDYMVVELASGGRELMEFMNENSALPLRGIKPRGSKGDRLDRVSPYIESGIVRFDPKLDPQAGLVGPDYGDLIGELLSFPVGEHDDLMDALVHGLRFATVVYPELVDKAIEEDAEALRPTSRVMVF
jgi:predicted phage terminase large subunit-like protein